MTKFYLRLLFLSLALIMAGCASSRPNAEERAAAPADASSTDAGPFDVPVPNVNLTNPLVVSTRPADVALCGEIGELIEKSPSANSHWGVIAVSLRDGRVACSRDGRKLFNPASIQKTLTAMVALDRLGPDFRWKTSAISASAIDPDGTLEGDLVLRGEGAPDFDNEALAALVDQLAAAGLKRVTGAVVGDSSHFRGEAIGDGWTWNELQWHYGAEASALTFNDNVAFVNVENGVAKTSTDYIRATYGNPTPIPSATGGTGESGALEEGGVRRGLGDNDFYIWGSSKNFGVRVAVHDPAKWAAKSLREALEKKGVAFGGETVSRDWRSGGALDPKAARTLAWVESKPLAEIVRKMNKNSVNLYAELILRTLGHNFGTEVPNGIQNPETVRGDDTAGAALVRKWLIEHRIAADDMRISDGSGLSRLDFATPEAFARAFVVAARSPYAQVFIDSLPVSGTDGTLGGRLGQARGKVLAKTGTVTYVNSLAGYVQNVDGEAFAFAVIVNNDTHKNLAVGLIDRIVLKLAGVAPDAKTPTPQPKTNANTSPTPNFVTGR